jgi:hypothetical protein
VSNGSWVLQDKRNATDDRGIVHSDRSKSSTPPSVAFSNDVWLVDYDAAVAEGLLATPTSARDVLAQIDRIEEGGQVTAAELRASIEKAKSGHEPSKDEVRQALAQAMRNEGLVVLKGTKEVTPGELTGDKVGFDDLVIKKVAAEDKGEYAVPKRKVLNETAATAAEKLTAWVAELIQGGHTTGLLDVALTVEVDEDSPNAASNLITMLGSVPEITDVTLTCEIEYGIDGVDGEMTIEIEAADRRQAQQKIKPLLTALSGKSAAPIAGSATVSFQLDEPHAPSSPKVTGLLKSVTTYFTGPVRIAGRVN